MQPIFQKVEANFDHSFYVDHMRFEYFPNPLHFHTDIEILFVLNGKGTRFVGDSIQNFGPGDIVMIGENVPHLWYSDENRDQQLSEVIFILFKTEIFGNKFWELPELKNILKLIQNSKRGIRLTGTTRKDVSALMKSINESNGYNRVTRLMLILEKIADGEYHFLGSPQVQNIINENDSDKLNKVYKFVIDHYQQNITLEKVSEIASLSVSSFCRYFKKRTNKTFIQFLNELRISFACRMLQEKDNSISAVCFSTGFNNVSFFIKQFRGVTGLTPLNYKKKHTSIPQVS